MDNNTKQTNSNQQTTDINQTTVNTVDQQNTPPVLSVEEVVPPMPQVGLPQKDEVLPENTKVEETKQEESGSAAPSDDIQSTPVVMGTTPKKKFGSNKVIATILGLFLLVGGLGAGTMLVQQNQDIRERAGACGGGCGSGGQCAGDVDGDGDGECVPRGTTDEEVEQAMNGGGGLGAIGGYEPAGQTDLGNGAVPSIENAGGGIQTWNEWQNEQQGINPTSNCTLPSNIDFLCAVGVPEISNHPNLPPGYTRYCSETTGRCSISGPACGGTICVVGEYRIGSSTGGGTAGQAHEETPPNNPPTTPPTITASCQNVKAYSSTWALLTNAQLAALAPNTTINFCVTGSASSGSFNKARFTINGALQAETTTVRPGGSDFCQSYVIPSGVTTFNVSAQINHATLGWK